MKLEGGAKILINSNFQNMNWVVIFNRLFEIINIPGDSYIGGGKFLDRIREVNYNAPKYTNYIEERRNQDKSTSRKDYYYDLLMEQPEQDRIRIVTNIVEHLGDFMPTKVAAIKQLLGQPSQLLGPQAEAPQNVWNAERLNEYLEKMDTSISEGKYEYTLTLAYTILEGFYKSFIKEKIHDQVGLDELVPMSVQIRKFIKGQLEANEIEYPDQTLPLISTVTNAICNARNKFSDSHSGNKAEKWLAIYMIDNVNSLAKLLLHFL